MTTQTPMSRAFVVHKDNEEGTLLIDHLTGRILTPLTDKPEWSQGLAAAIPQERATHYIRALGKEGAQDLLNADAVNFADLSWVGMNGGEPEEISADPTFRAEVIAKLTGVSAEGVVEGKTYERELAMENSRRTPEEQAALDKAIEQGFRAGKTIEQATKDAAQGG